MLLCCLVSSPPLSQSCPRYFFCASHYFKYLCTLSCMNFATALMAKLTLNYSHCTDEEMKHKTRKLLSQDLNLISGFRVHICSLSYTGGENFRTQTHCSQFRSLQPSSEISYTTFSEFPRTDFWPVGNPGPKCLLHML